MDGLAQSAVVILLNSGTDSTPPNEDDVMSAPNCWEFKDCGREPGGAHVTDDGACPAATHQGADGINHGVCAGRACWAVAGTLCGGEVQGSWAQKRLSCLSCDFYRAVKSEERRADFQVLLPEQSGDPMAVTRGSRARRG